MNAILDRFVGNISPVALLVSSFFWSWFDIVPFSPALFTAAGVPFDMKPAGGVAHRERRRTRDGRPERAGLREQVIGAKAFALCSLLCGAGGTALIYAGALASLPALLVAGGVLIGIYGGTAPW